MSGPMDAIQIEKMVQDAVRSATDKQHRDHGSNRKQAPKRIIRTPYAPPWHLLGGNGSTGLWNVILGGTSGSPKWQLESAIIYDDTQTALSVSNLKTDIALNTGGDWLYLEVPISSGSIGTLTVKAAGSSTMPGGGFYQYVQSGSGASTVNTQTYIRIPLATVLTAAPTISPPWQSKAIFLLDGAANMKDASNSNQVVVGGLIFT